MSESCPTCEKPLTHCNCRGANVINAERDMANEVGREGDDELENLTEEEQEELEEEYEEEEEEEWDDDDDSDDDNDEEEE